MEKIVYKVIEKLPKQQGVSQNNVAWESQEIVVEDTAQVQYPDRVLLRFSSDKVKMLDGINVGDMGTAAWSARVRAFKTGGGRDIRSQEKRGWKIEKV